MRERGNQRKSHGQENEGLYSGGVDEIRGNHMAKKRKAKKSKIRRKRTVKKSKAKTRKPKKKRSPPEINVFTPAVADEELERAAGLRGPGVMSGDSCGGGNIPPNTKECPP